MTGARSPTTRRTAIACAAATLATLACGAGADQSAAASAAPPPGTAAAAVVADASDGAVMFERDGRQRRAIASTTKLMTALLALERTRPREVLTAPTYHPLPAESRIDLRPGERMTVHDLLRALLLESANDAAVTLARGVAGSRAAFVREMNERAARLGLRDTRYANPVGLDEPGNYSSARDLAALATRLMRNGTFAAIVDLPEAELDSGRRRRVVHNRNLLVGRYPFVDGIKTGHTVDAGYVLVGAATGRAGQRVVSVVLGEPSESARDRDTLALLRWGLGRFRRVRALDTSRPVARLRIAHRGGRARVLPRQALSVTARRGERISRRLDVPDRLDGPIAAGARVGSVTVLVDGVPQRKVDLITARDVPGAGPLRVLFSALGIPLTLLLALGILVCIVVGTRRLGVRLRLVRE